MQKLYTQEEINKMNENRVNELFEKNIITDDMVQRYFDNKEEIECLVKEYIMFG